MAGTKLGGLRCAETNKKRYGEDYYKRIGTKGGSVKSPRKLKAGFGSDPELARLAGAKGGRISKRGASQLYIVSKEGKEVKRGKLSEVASYIGYSTGAVYVNARRGRQLGGYEVEVRSM